MQLFGYALKRARPAPTALREVSIVGSALELRQLADFLHAMASRLDAGDSFDHVHLEDYYHAQRVALPSTPQVVVVAPK